MEQTDLRAPIEAYRRSLPPGQFSSFRIDPVDYLDVPIVNVDLFAEGGGHFNGIGYGATELAATLGAYGELCEETHLILSYDALDTEDGSYAEMAARYGAAVIDPLTLVLSAGSPYHPSMHLRWAPIENLLTGERAWAPAEFVATTNGQVHHPNALATAIRNGSGAGDTEERALLHGALELLQRDGNADCFRALDRGIVIDPHTVPAAVRNLMVDLAAKGLHITLKLARVTCGCVSVYAVGDDRTDDDFPLGVTATGEGCDMDAETAMRKAVLECASSHSRKRFNNLSWARKAPVLPTDFRAFTEAALDLDAEEQRALRQMVNWVNSSREDIRDRLAGNVFLRRTTVDAGDLPTFGETGLKARLQFVLDQFAKEGLTPYVFRATTTGGHCHAVKLIVPGIEQELGSYHRIGVRNVERLLRRSDVRLIAREAGPGRRRIRLTPADEARVGGAVWLEADQLDALVSPVYPLYREPSAHAAVHAIETDYFTARTTPAL